MKTIQRPGLNIIVTSINLIYILQKTNRNFAAALKEDSEPNNAERLEFLAKLLAVGMHANAFVRRASLPFIRQTP